MLLRGCMTSEKELYFVIFVYLMFLPFWLLYIFFVSSADVSLIELLLGTLVILMDLILI